MCGLAGVISSNMTTPQVDAFKELMIVSMLRGREGAGISLIRKGGKINTVRTIATGAHLIFGEKFSKVSSNLVDLNIMSGHCRWPTRGEKGQISDVHPHIYEHISGVHNGTLDKVDDNWLSQKVSDSAELFKSIAIHGIDKAIEGVQGAYALAWVDQKAKTFNFLRNKDRPLWIAHPKDNTRVIFWASERPFLEFILGRRFRDIVFSEVPEDKLISYKIDVPQHQDIIPVEERVVKAKPRVFYHSANPQWWEGEWESRFNRLNPDDELPPVFNERNVGGVRSGPYGTGRPYVHNQNNVHALEYRGQEKTYETSPNHFLTHSVFQKVLFQDGCSWCTQSATTKEYEDKLLKWVGPKEFLCVDCAKDDSIIPFLQTVN